MFQPLFTLHPAIYEPRRALRRQRSSDETLDPYVNRLFLRR